MALCGLDLDVVIEATGAPGPGERHALAAIEAGRYIVMVNVEADALAGPALAARARAAGVVYSLAYGDQPGRWSRNWSIGRAQHDHVRQSGGESWVFS